MAFLSFFPAKELTDGRPLSHNKPPLLIPNPPPPPTLNTIKHVGKLSLFSLRDEFHSLSKLRPPSARPTMRQYPPLILPLRLLLFLALFIETAWQVDVTIGGKRWLFSDEAGNFQIWTAGCHDLQPGECCMKPPGLLLDPGFVVFTGLQDLDIAFLWKTRLLSQPGAFPVVADEACSGDSFRSQVGGPTWTYKWGANDPSNGNDPAPRAAGANYLRLPPKLPPSSTEVDWLGMEGLGGFVWDKGTWSSSSKNYQISSFLANANANSHLRKVKRE
ncbi:MAG: hypothetical protein LQ352_006304, partial [Teloschistes flavicans]